MAKKNKPCIEAKETYAMRMMRIEETENGRKFREKRITSKKIYNRKSKYWTFSVLC